MKILSTLCLASLVLAGCTTPPAGRSPIAIYSSDEQGYTIVLSDRRNLMAHDPLSLLSNATYKVESHIKSKTMTGTVDSAAIQVIELRDFNGKFRLRTLDRAKGTISFNGKELTVDLWTSKATTEKLEPYEFNGTYQLSLPVQ